jgi:folate-dependent phosphoribosylglycinamide formyltransferase PurN
MQTVTVVILTGSELRHTFMRKAIARAQGIKVLRSYCEGLQASLDTIVRRQGMDDDIRLSHLAARDAAERDFFAAAVALLPDDSAPVLLPKGAINEPSVAEEIAALGPDLLAAYGCSLVRDPLLSRFAGRFLNVHLGLSPYYRGAGTNFWPLVDGRPEYVGATFMHLDAGVDTGEIIHQIRAAVEPGDTPHQIGNRLIRDVAFVYPEVMRRFRELEPMPQPPIPHDAKVLRKKDFSAESVERLYAAFGDGLVARYLGEREQRCSAVPIVENPAVRTSAALMGRAP